MLAPAMPCPPPRDAALTAHYRPLIAIADATPAAIEATIAAVTFAPDKARHLVRAMAIVRAARPDGDLGFLGGLPIADALAWLERLPGVGRKVAAATLNASPLARPVFIVDTHILRVLARLGLVDAHAGYREASEAMTAAMPGWDGDDFLRFHLLTKRLGQVVCRWDTPDCPRCPLRSGCSAARPKGLNSIRTRSCRPAAARLPVEDRRAASLACA